MDVFEAPTYRNYLKNRLGGLGHRTGQKAAAAQAIACHPTYLSQVLNDKADLSLEQAERLSSHLNHSKDETDFFLLLVLKARAGTSSLRAHFQDQIDAQLTKRLMIKNRIDKKTRISSQDEAKFYSSWYYGVTHVLVSIPALRTREALLNHLKISAEQLSEILEFLTEIGLIEKHGEKYQHGPKMVHLGSDSANIVRHHLNWRLRCMRVIEERNASEVHYSAAVSLSQKDAEKMKRILVDSLKKNLDLIVESKEEVAYGYCFDFFKI